MKTVSIQQLKTVKKSIKKEMTLLDEFKEAFVAIKNGRIYDWDEIEH